MPCCWVFPPSRSLEAHARLTAAPVSPDFRAIAPQREITSRHHQVRFVTYFMAAIVIGLAIAWWQGRDVRPPNPLLAVRDSEPAVAAPEPCLARTPLPSRRSCQLNRQPPTVGIAVTGSKPPALVAPSGSTAASTPTVVPQSIAVVPASVAQPAGPRIKLVLHADQDSWADIRDARQTRLLYDTVPAGRSVTLEGVAPVSVFRVMPRVCDWITMAKPWMLPGTNAG